MDLPKPSAVALIVCDSVYREASGKVALIGLFTRIAARRFPATHQRMSVYASLTGFQPGTTVKVDIVPAEAGGNPIAEIQGPVPDVAGPLVSFELAAELRNVAFPAPGFYLVRLLVNDELLLRRPIQAVIAGGEPPEGGDDHEK